jgi:flagellar export protein FliJ
MQRFQFRLDRVLEFRRHQCTIEEGRLGVCLLQVQAVERKMEQLQAERTAIDHELLTRSGIPAADFLNLGRYRLRAAKEEAELVEERRRKLQAVTEQRTKVQKAQQRVKLLEKMRTRRLEEYTVEASRELEEAAAESYMVRWSHAHRR